VHRTLSAIVTPWCCGHQSNVELILPRQPVSSAGRPNCFTTYSV